MTRCATSARVDPGAGLTSSGRIRLDSVAAPPDLVRGDDRPSCDRDVMRRAALVLVATATILVGCSGNGNEEEYVERPVEELYNEAQDLLQDGSPQQAGQA